MAVKINYKNVYRDPLGYPEWHAKNLPVETSPAGLADISQQFDTSKPLEGWAIIWTLLGIFVGGIILNLTPCVYPLIPITVSYLVFFTLSFGLVLPLFFLAMFSGKLDKLPRSGEWMVWIRKLMGWVLMGMAAYFIRPLLTQIPGILELSAVALTAGLHLGWIDRTRAAFRAFNWMRSLFMTVKLSKVSIACS